MRRILMVCTVLTLVLLTAGGCHDGYTTAQFGYRSPGYFDGPRYDYRADYCAPARPRYYHGCHY